MVKKLLFIALGTLTVPFLSHAAGPAKPFSVLATIKPLALIAESVTRGTTVEVETLLPVEASPHHYALKVSDARRLQQADLLLWLGPSAEPYVTKGGRYKSLPVLSLLPADQLIRTGERTLEDHGHRHEAGPDPHVWLDSRLALLIANHLVRELSLMLPEQKKLLEQNLQQLEAELKDLDGLIAKELAPLQNKGFFVYHDAYQYLFRRYGLRAQGVVLERAGEAGLSVRHLSELQTLAAQQGAICLFREPQFLRAAMPGLGQQVRVHEGMLDPLGIDASSYSDLMRDLSKGMSECLSQLAGAGPSGQ